MKASFQNDDSKQSLPLNDNDHLTPTDETEETTLETPPSASLVRTPTTPTTTTTPMTPMTPIPPPQPPSAAVALAEEIKLKFLENQTLATPRNGRTYTKSSSSNNNSNNNNNSNSKQRTAQTPFYSPASTSSSFQEETISNATNANGNVNGNVNDNDNAYALEEGFLTAPLPMGVKPSTTFALQLASSTTNSHEKTSRMGSKSGPTGTGTIGTSSGTDPTTFTNKQQPKEGYKKKYSRWNYAQKYDLKNVGLGLGALRQQQTSSIPSRRSSTNANTNVNGGNGIGGGGRSSTVVYSRQETSMQGNGNSNGESSSNTNDNDDDMNMGPIEDVEWTIRNRRTNSCWNFLRSSTAALLVFLVYLITLETILSCALTIGLTLYWFHQYQEEAGGGADSSSTSSSTWNGSGLDWVVLGFGT